jgi:hypothetical protein
MEPIVNGLAQDYQDRIDFRNLNANQPDEKALFQFLGLRGHPAYVIMNPQGEVLWQGVGEQTRENIQMMILAALENQ